MGGPGLRGSSVLDFKCLQIKEISTPIMADKMKNRELLKGVKFKLNSPSNYINLILLTI